MSTVIKLVIKPYTTKELAPLYNMCSRTFRRNIAGIKEQLGERKGHFYNIKQVELIIAHMGRPYEVIEQ
jgi:hypothetical protein